MVAGKTMDRRSFLKLGGAGLAGTTLLGIAGCARGGGGGGGGGEKVFALVPKQTNDPNFVIASDGCKAAAKKLGVTCDYVGPTSPDEAEQIRVLQDEISRQPDGISVSPLNAESVGRIIDQAVNQGINAITFDSDAPDSKRAAYVGTNNTQLGKELGNLLKKNKPDGGTYAMITGTLAASNLNQRIKGVRSVLGPEYEEVQGSPYPCQDEVTRSVQLVGDILTRYSDLDAIVSVGGWPLFAPEGYREALGQRVEDVRNGQLVVVVADTVEEELKALQAGLATGLVGQRFYEMGYKSMEVLNEMAEGKEPAKEHFFTGLDTVTRQNVDEYIKKQEGR
jgi:ribose transport system substrate-binding protein